jgi:hypothetical protein
MSHSMYGADRNTHIKVLVVGVLGAFLVVIAGFAAQVGDANIAGTNGRIEPDRVMIRAGGPGVMTSNPQKSIH